eukprot:TRINITY_DN7703_c0_g1_i1.p1 TRINITY_DN7703_c0_g1~~TRINITY_DN7703_c0_g1_i1.p1  ORF type:complete len:132 (-),score=41.04 TRINITY_DN7703_c0_g1_i1:158-553(-)
MPFEIIKLLFSTVRVLLTEDKEDSNHPPIFVISFCHRNAPTTRRFLLGAFEEGLEIENLTPSSSSFSAYSSGVYIFSLFPARNQTRDLDQMKEKTKKIFGDDLWKEIEQDNAKAADEWMTQLDEEFCDVFV